MAGIIVDVSSDIQKLQKLKAEIASVKQEVKGIDIRVRLDIKESIETRLKALSEQYTALVMKIAEAEGKIKLSVHNINKASEAIIQAQEKMSKVTGATTQQPSTTVSPSNISAETASIQAQAKAYEDLRTEINAVLGTREANIKRMLDEKKAIDLINAEIKKITKSQGDYGNLSSAKQKRLEQLNNSLLTHKAALAEVRQVLGNNVKMDNAAATSMDALGQSLSRMRITYRGLTEEERKSPFGKELLSSIQQADVKIKELDASIGNHARNVGNYKKEWNGLQYQMQIFSRELPNFAISPQTGIISLTNNLPYLVDELKKAKDAHKAYIAEVKAGNKDLKAVPSVGKQILTSLFSWQTGLIMAITLITAYRKEISEWVGGLFKAKDATNNLVNMQNKLNDIYTQGLKNAQSELTKIDALYKATQSETHSKEEKLRIIRKLQQEYPSYFGNLSEEAILAGKAEIAYSKLADSITKSAIAKGYADSITQNVKETIDLEREVDELLKKQSKLEKEQSENFNGLGKGAAKAVNASRDIFDLGKKIADNEDKILEKQSELRKKEIERFSLKSKLNAVDFLFDPTDINPMKNTKGYWEEQKNIALTSIGQISNEYLEVLKSGSTKGIPQEVIDQYKQAVKLKAEADKALKVYDDPTNQDNQTEKLLQQQEKYNLLLDKQKREQERMKTDSLHELEQIEINALQEGSEKILRQRALNHQKELEAIKREADDKKLRVIEEARSAFEANPDKNKGTFDADKFVKSEPVKKQFAVFDKVAEEKTKTTETKYNRGDDLAGLLSEYQDYTDKRLAIETKFNNDIATLEEQRKLALKNDDTKQVEEIDRAKAQATKNKGMELMSMDYDKLKESPEYVRAFENLKETSSETLNSLLSQLENAKGAAAKVLSPDQLREYTTTIQEIMDELDSRNPFQALADRKKELAEAEEELAEAKRNLDTVNSGGKVASGTKLNGKTGKIDTTYLSSTQALEKYNKAKDKSVKSDAKVKKAEKEVTDVVGELSKSIKEVGDAIGGSAGEIISLIGDIGLFAMTAMSGVSTASTTASKSIQAVEKASVILAIIGAAIQIAMKIASLFKDDDGVAAYEKAKDVYESYIDILDRVIEKQKELFELNSKTGEQAYEKAKETVKKQENASRELGKQYLNSGASKGFLGISSSASEGVKQRDDMSSKALNEAKKVLGRDYNKATDGRMTGLFDMSAKQLADLQRDAPLFWAELHDDTQKYLQQIIDCNEELTKLEQDRMEGLVKTDFSSFSDSFLDVLTDLDSSSQDFADNFEKYLQNAILTSLITDKYKSNIEALYKQWADDTESGNKLTEDEAIALRKKQEELANSMLEERNQLMKDFGWTSGESTSQNSTKGGFQAMSQDTGDELNGRFTALQISGEETKNQNILQTQSLNLLTMKSEDILRVNSEIKDIADETRDLIANSYLELVQISENTGAIVKPIQQMQKDMEEVKKNTSKL